MERYAEYWDSDIFWIGEVPNQWNYNRIKYLYKIISGNGFPEQFQGNTEGELPFFKVSDINGEGVFVSDSTNYVTYELTRENHWNIVPPRSLLMAKIGAALSKNHRKINIADCIIDNNCQALVTIGSIHERFSFYYWLLINMSWFDNGGTIPSVNNQKLLNQKICIPDYITQTAIATYLDRRTSEIDALLADLQAQVKRLDTYKRELIAEAVTKGLDKAMPMKDSGVDWIGDVSTHWEVTKTKWMFEIVKQLYDKEDRDVLSITQQGLKVKDIESNDGQLAESYIGYQIVNVKDFAMNSMDLLTGWVDCSPFEGVTSPDYRVFRFHPFKPQCHRYYKYLFQMCYKNRIFYRLGQGVSNLGRWRLQADQFLNMRFPQPPIQEQEEIAAYLDEKTAQVEDLIADITEQIEKLKQYRKIVIHDAVTGKIKVAEVRDDDN